MTKLLAFTVQCTTILFNVVGDRDVFSWWDKQTYHASERYVWQRDSLNKRIHWNAK